MYDLGTVYDRQGKVEMAEAMLSESLAARRLVLGDLHPDTVTSIRTLGVLYRREKQYALAEPLYSEYLDALRGTYGAEHVSTLHAMHNLGGLYFSQEKMYLAEPLLAECLRVRRVRLGKEHQDTHSTLSMLARLYFDDRKLQKAEELYVELYESLRDKFGAENADCKSAYQSVEIVREHKQKEASGGKVKRLSGIGSDSRASNARMDTSMIIERALSNAIDGGSSPRLDQQQGSGAMSNLLGRHSPRLDTHGSTSPRLDRQPSSVALNGILGRQASFMAQTPRDYSQPRGRVSLIEASMNNAYERRLSANGMRVESSSPTKRGSLSEREKSSPRTIEEQKRASLVERALSTASNDRSGSKNSSFRVDRSALSYAVERALTADPEDGAVLGEANTKRSQLQLRTAELPPRIDKQPSNGGIDDIIERQFSHGDKKRASIIDKMLSKSGDDEVSLGRKPSVTIGKNKVHPDI
eukprot:CAMPEP_0182432890 /NCGR_PEP_ID=MMETSP1167-20130531/59605_1 /TAXON_ID=2988 /ORGANISM="Mallomonas Sp, Strain CCMP3275" /LENGTH=468 /DNA_ID=CAMNT_0024620949 /DNA_START=351 /DNA_END=1757 /DNA_ORIENTATION=+